MNNNRREKNVNLKGWALSASFSSNIWIEANSLKLGRKAPNNMFAIVNCDSAASKRPSMCFERISTRKIFLTFCQKVIFDYSLVLRIYMLIGCAGNCNKTYMKDTSYGRLFWEREYQSLDNSYFSTIFKNVQSIWI